MVSSIRISRFIRLLSLGVFSVIVSLGCSDVRAQVTGGTSTTGTTGTATGATGSQFQGAELDMSAFEGIERGDSIGSSTTQGFGVAAESTGGPGGGGAAGGGGGGGGFGGGGFGGLGGLFGGLGGAFGGQSTSTQKPIIRVRLKSAINIPPRPAAEVQRSARRALSITSTRSGMQSVTVTMDGRTAILSGTVGSEKDRRMSELLIRLEPGVSQVDNQVVVASEN